MEVQIFPPRVGRDGVNIGLIWIFGKSEYFFRRGWTLVLLEAHLICPSGNRPMIKPDQTKRNFSCTNESEFTFGGDITAYVPQ
jgi:hypothetical protein